MRSLRTRFGAHAFTLLEVVIAAALLAVILTILVSGTYTIVESWSRVNSHTEHLEEILVLDRTIDSILSNVVPFTWPADIGERQPKPVQIFVGEPDHMIVSYLHQFNRLEDGAIRYCGFFIDRHSDLYAYYCDSPPFPSDLNDPKIKKSYLAAGVENIAFQYGDMNNDELIFEDTWDPEHAYLPLAILMQVKWFGGRHENWLRRTAGAGLYERHGSWQSDRQRSRVRRRSDQ